MNGARSSLADDGCTRANNASVPDADSIANRRACTKKSARADVR